MVQWQDVPLGEFVERGERQYVMKLCDVQGDVNVVALHETKTVAVYKHVTARGRTVGYSIAFKKKARVFLDAKHMMAFFGQKPNTKHKLGPTVIKEPMFLALTFRAGSEVDYMFINRLRESAEDSDDEEDGEEDET